MCSSPVTHCNAYPKYRSIFGARRPSEFGPSDARQAGPDLASLNWGIDCLTRGRFLQRPEKTKTAVVR
jgi:hypothetical protein